MPLAETSGTICSSANRVYLGCDFITYGHPGRGADLAWNTGAPNFGFPRPGAQVDTVADATGGLVHRRPVLRLGAATGLAMSLEPNLD